MRVGAFFFAFFALRLTRGRDEADSAGHRCSPSKAVVDTKADDKTELHQAMAHKAITPEDDLLTAQGR